MALVESISKLKKGMAAPNFSLEGVDGKTHSLPDFKNAKALLVIFMCNHCPYVKPKIDAIKKLQDDFGKKGLVIVGINPNSEKIVPEDSFAHMKALAKERKINFIYLRDETQEVAKAYGASCTPDPFLFDSNQKLVFHSRLNSNHGKEGAEEMHTTISEFLNGKQISVGQEPSMGCSIKWKGMG